MLYPTESNQITMSGDNIPWIEKHRPVTIEEVVQDEMIRSKIYSTIAIGRATLLIGPCGTGKTTLARALARETLGDKYDKEYRELNAGDDRGTKSVSVITDFCSAMYSEEDKRSDKPVRIVMFDELDNTTAKCQIDICKMIEKYKRVLFIATGNDLTKIDENMQSLCTIIRFQLLTLDQITAFTRRICKKEKIKVDEEGLSLICTLAEGDMRRSINNLQKTVQTFGDIKKSSVLKICNVPDPDNIQIILNHCSQKRLTEALEILGQMMDKGCYCLDIITGFNHVIVQQKMDERKRLQLLDAVKQTKIVCSKGSKSRLQLCAMVCRIMKAMRSGESTGW